MDKTKQMDNFLQKRADTYDKWVRNGTIAFSSKVIPVHESLPSQQWILPTEQVTKICRDVKTIALLNCACRSFYNRCNNPLETCLEFVAFGERSIKEGRARHITYDEAVAILSDANKKGLIHLALYRPDHKLYALCSCCSCCCHDLQLVMRFGRRDLMMRSEYVAVTDRAICSQCGTCIDCCIFDARTRKNNGLHYETGKCYGCGLCVTTCPANAISMKRWFGNRVVEE